MYLVPSRRGPLSEGPSQKEALLKEALLRESLLKEALLKEAPLWEGLLDSIAVSVFILFLAVQNSSIGDLVTHSLTH